MFPERHIHRTLGPHTAHRLAAKLRGAGVYTCGKDVMDWSFTTTRLAIQWVDHVYGRRNAPSFAEHLGEHMPPPSAQSWLPLPVDNDCGDRAES